MTLIIALVALGAAALVVVMLVIAFVLPPMDDKLIDKAESRTPSSPRPPTPLRQVTVRRSGPISALRDAPARRATPATRAIRIWKPAWPALRGITEIFTAWRRELSHDLRYIRARRRRELNGATWVAVTIALSAALSYLIVHL